MKSLAAFALIAALCAPAGAQFEQPDGPRDLPDFALSAATSKSLRTLSKKDLLGKVWVADFIFTRCQGQCPLLTQRMRGLQKRLPKEILLVSFTIDPEYDRPKVLRAYAKANGADPDRWLFAAGKDQASMIPLLKDGFGTAYRKDDSSTCGFSTVHSSKFALVGRDGRVVLTYSGDETDAVDRLERDAVGLLAGRLPPQ
jgi:cytochrome oxidase Cu insertion factor (SCO1/SenC/PrrC family)